MEDTQASALPPVLVYPALMEFLRKFTMRSTQKVSLHRHLSTHQPEQAQGWFRQI